jgi:hypothetical protein
MDSPVDEATLQDLEEQIEREEKEIAALLQRTRTLEVEVAAWPPPHNLHGLFAAALRRARLEVVVGAVLAFAVFGLGWALLAVIEWGRS